jgi:protein-tyrosine phosphatase
VGMRAYPARVIDLHSHVLPGLDDGARDLADSRELARRAAADGITAIAATPHVRDDYPTSAAEMEAGVEALRDDFAQQGIPVEILHGAEIDLGFLVRLDVADLRRYTIAQTGRYLLVEFPYRGWPLNLEQTIFDLAVAGIAPILAHPERNADVQADASRLAPMVDRGALVQITAASLDGRIGRRSKKAAEQIIRAGHAHLLASDAHTPEIREVGLAGAVEALGNRALARHLTLDVPAAIVAGEPVPPRPETGGRRRFLRR